MAISIMDFEKCASISGLVASPDGRCMAGLIHRPDFDSNGYLVRLCLFDPSGKSDPEVISEADYPPVFFLREEGLVYEKGRSPEGISLQMRQPDGTDTEWRTLPFQPSTLLNCSKELYGLVSHPRPPEPPLPGSVADPLAICDIADEFPFISNGRGFFSGCKNAIHRYSVADQSSERLSGPEFDVEILRTYGNSVCFTARHVNDGLLYPGLYRLGQNGAPEQLIPSGSYRIFDFCSDGDSIFFVAQKTGDSCMTDNPRFYCLKDGKIRSLSHPELSYGSKINSDCLYGTPTPLLVSNDSFYFIESGEFSSFVSRLNTDGSLIRLTSDNGSVDSFCFAGDSLFFAGLRGIRPHDIYRQDGNREVRLTCLNQETITDDMLSIPERFSFIAEDGYQVNYVVLPPHGYSPKEAEQSHPALLYIHGGAKTNYSTVFFHEMQFLAGQGYFVVYGNPHGSDGQDSNFARLKGHYFEQDCRDVLKAADLALEHYPAIDPKRFAVVGGSYGGILTNWIIGRTDRFACAVTQRSLCNMISAFGTADNGAGFVSEQMEGTPWEDIENLWRQSPLRLANQIKTPLLIIHADEDYRCHFSEAMQLYTALRYHGIESRLCLVRGETHELSRKGKPAQRLLRLREIAAWLKTYIS